MIIINNPGECFVMKHSNVVIVGPVKSVKWGLINFRVFRIPLQGFNIKNDEKR